MTELEINQLLHEKVMGKCWHTYLSQRYTSQRDEFSAPCIKCKRELYWLDGEDVNPSYTSSWANYGPILEECMMKEWWDVFCDSLLPKNQRPRIGDERVIPPLMLNPLRGSTAIAEFVEANPKYFKGE